MRTFSAGFQAKLDSNSYLPVVFCKYELVTLGSGEPVLLGFEEIFSKTFISVDSLTQEQIDLYLLLDFEYTPVYSEGSATDTTTYYWSERSITYSGDLYEARIVNTSALEKRLEADHQAFGSMGLQILNSPTNIAGSIQAGMKCTVFLGFEDDVDSGTVTEAEVIFVGIIEGDIEITEDSVSFGLQDIAHVYDRQVPALITRTEYPYADPDAIGDTKPIIMGRVEDHVCRPVASGHATVIALDSNEGDTSIYVVDDINWWNDMPLYGPLILNTTYDRVNKITVDWEESASVISITYDQSLRLWKITFDLPLVRKHNAGDTAYIDNLYFKLVEGYAYLVADHPVESITNVKVDGLPAAVSEIITNYDGLNDSLNRVGLKQNKAYVVVYKNAGVSAVSGAAGLTISDTTNVVDETGVNDAIGISDFGHDHYVAGTAVIYQHQIDIDWGATIFGQGYGSIHLRSGSTFIEFYDYAAGFSKTTQSPVTFASTSPDVYITVNGNQDLRGSFIFNYVNVQAVRTSVNGTSYAVTSFSNIYYQTGRELPYSIDSGAGALTSESVANVLKQGQATKYGEAYKTGTVSLISGNSAADVFVGQRVTCNVSGMCDGSTGLVYPHHQIKKLINKYARNPINGDAGNADIVEFVNEAEANEYFDKVYNTDLYSDASSYYPNINRYDVLTISADPEDWNQSPAYLLNQRITSGIHALDFAITEPNRLRDIVGDMLYQSNCTINWRNGVAYIKFVSDQPEKNDSISSSDIVMKSMSMARSLLSDLATDVSVRYDYSQSKDYKGLFEYKNNTGTVLVPSLQPLSATLNLGTYSKERVYDLSMIRDQVGAEIVAKRIVDKYSSPKFQSRVSTTLKNLHLEPADFVDVETPIYSNGKLDRGLVESVVFSFGSAVDKSADLIHLSVLQSHIDNSFYLGVGDVSDQLSISDDSINFSLNDANTIFQDLDDNLSISEQISVNKGIGLNDSVSISESLVFNYELSLTDSVLVNDDILKFTGILFWAVDLNDSLSLAESVSQEFVDPVFDVGVFEQTDVTRVGVFE